MGNSILFLLFLSWIVLTAPALAQPSPKPPAPTKPLAESVIGDSKVFIKLVAVKDNPSVQNQFGGPRQGNKFVAIQLTLTNKGTEDWRFDTSNFKVKDAEANVYNVDTIVEPAEPTLKSGLIDAGDIVKGWISFQIGETLDVKSLKLRYEGGFDGGGSRSGWIAVSAIAK